MIHADEKGVAVTGAGLDVMAQLGMVIHSVSGSPARGGLDRDKIKAYMHHLVDVALEAPETGVTIDLSIHGGGDERVP